MVELLLTSKLSNDQRDSSIVWELKHSSGCCQLGRLLAQKRGLDVEIAEIACVLHDIYVIIKGKYKNHAPLGTPIAEKILKDTGGFSKNQIKIICEGVYHHSEKEIYTNEPYTELVKDADVLDCCLYKGAEGYYRLHKPKEVVDQYTARIKKVKRELGLNPTYIWRK